MLKKLKGLLKRSRNRLRKKKEKKQSSSPLAQEAHEERIENNSEGENGKNKLRKKLFDKEKSRSSCLSTTSRTSKMTSNHQVAGRRSNGRYDITSYSLHKKKNENGLIDMADIIFAIPPQVMNTSVKLAVYEYGSNVLHLACHHGTSIRAIRYIFDNCRPDTQLDILQQPDREGNLPIHSLVSCLCRDQMPLDDGIDILELFHKIWPESVFELNSNEKLVTDIIFEFQRKKDEDSDEFKKLDELCTNLRHEMVKVWKLKQEIREMERTKYGQIAINAVISTLASKIWEEECGSSKVSSTNAMKNRSTCTED